MRNVKRRFRVTLMLHIPLITAEYVNLPGHERSQLFQVIQVIQKGEHFAKLIEGIGRNILTPGL
jgi:hypothetical protein